MNVLSENEPEITECLSQTQIVTNLLRLQNTTFQTCSHSKYSPIIPRLIFKASLFSLSPPTTNPRTSSNRERERETEEMRGAFKSSVPWVVGSVSGNLSHPVYAGQISAPGPQRAGKGLCLDTAPLSLFYLLPASLSKRSPSAKLSTPPPSYQRLQPKANKHTSGSLSWRPPQEYDQGWNQKILIEESFLCSRQTKCG